MQSILLAASVHRHSRQLSKRPLLQLECQSYQRRLRRAAHNLQNNQRRRAGQARRVTYHFGFVGGCVESLVCFFEWRRKIRRNRVEQDLHAFVFVAGNTVTSHENRYNTSSAPQQRTHALPIRTGTKAVLTVARLMAASSCELVGSLSDKKMSPCWFITREIYKLKKGESVPFLRRLLRLPRPERGAQPWRRLPCRAGFQRSASCCLFRLVQEGKKRGERWRDRGFAFEINGAHVDDIDQARQLVLEADGQSGERAGQSQFFLDLRQNLKKMLMSGTHRRQSHVKHAPCRGPPRCGRTC